MSDVNVVFKRKKKRGNIREKTTLSSVADESVKNTSIDEQVASFKRQKTGKNAQRSSTQNALYQSTRSGNDSSSIHALVYETSGTAVSSSNAAYLAEAPKNDESADVPDLSSSTLAENGEDGEQVYTGTKTYLQQQAELDKSRSKSARMGPIRASNYVRCSIRFDYAPDICKDYKQTGTCGYGDNCKFMHTREDYKTGWQIDRDYEEEQKKKAEEERMGIKNDAKDEKKDDGLPFACFICRKPFKNPVVTNCKHYFCQKCALKRFKKTNQCAVCKLPTGGTFNLAKNIIAKMEQAEKAPDAQDEHAVVEAHKE